MIDKLRHTHPVDKLCQLVDVAKSGYQTWSCGKVIPARRLEDARLVTAIKAAHQRGRGIYGPKKIQTAQAGVRSSTITFDVSVILDFFEKYDNKRPDPICLFAYTLASRCGLSTPSGLWPTPGWGQSPAGPPPAK